MLKSDYPYDHRLLKICDFVWDNLDFFESLCGTPISAWDYEKCEVVIEQTFWTMTLISMYEDEDDISRSMIMREEDFVDVFKWCYDDNFFEDYRWLLFDGHAGIFAMIGLAVRDTIKDEYL